MTAPVVLRLVHAKKALDDLAGIVASERAAGNWSDEDQTELLTQLNARVMRIAGVNINEKET